MTTMFESIFISLILISVVSSQVSKLDKCKSFEICETDADCHGGKCLGNKWILAKSCRCNIPTSCIWGKKCEKNMGHCGEAIGGYGYCKVTLKNHLKL